MNEYKLVIWAMACFFVSIGFCCVIPFDTTKFWMVWPALGLCVLGFILMMIQEYIDYRKKKKEDGKE